MFLARGSLLRVALNVIMLTMWVFSIVKDVDFTQKFLRVYFETMCRWICQILMLDSTNSSLPEATSRTNVRSVNYNKSWKPFWPPFHNQKL